MQTSIKNQLRAIAGAAAAAGMLAGCAHKPPAAQFSATAPYSRNFTGAGDAVCWSVKRALLSQGYMLDRPNESGVMTGSRDQQPTPKLNVTTRLQTTCADNRNGTSIVFVTATREENKLQKMQQSTSMGVEPRRTLKTLIVAGSDEVVVALVLRGDHELNVVKAQKLPGIATPLRLATPAEVQAASGTEPGYVGPVGLAIRIYADHAALALADFVCGANERDMHFRGVNWGRDLEMARGADLRNVIDGDLSPTGGGRLRLARGIEVGHIFQLGRKYSDPMKAMVLNEAGEHVPVLMGCYGIGVTRLVAAAIEQNHDERGIRWPAPIAPFQVVLVPLNLHKSNRVREISDGLYSELTGAGIEVLYDDRDARPGIKFADSELLGIPHRLVVAERGLDSGMLEYRGRGETQSTDCPIQQAIPFLQGKLAD